LQITKLELKGTVVENVSVLTFEDLLFIIVLTAAIFICAFWDLSAFVKVLQTISQDDGATISKGD
jgi:hypothetical protein